MMVPRLLPRAAARVVLAGSLALLAACPASSAGLSVAWKDCRPPLGTGFDTWTFGCADAAIDGIPLFPSFSLPAAMDSVYSMELVIDVIVAGAEGDPLPAWWLMAPGSCRTNGWAADGAPSTSCNDAWGGLGTGSFQGWIPGTPGNSTRHARLLVAMGTLPQNAVTLLGNTSYTAGRVILRTTNTVACDAACGGTPGCSGCSTPACMVFNSLLVRRLHTPADQEILVSGAEIGGSDRITWQEGLGADCAAVPTRRTTWGAVKALYR